MGLFVGLCAGLLQGMTGFGAGIILILYLPMILLGAIGIILGSLIAKRLLKYIDENKIRKFIYIVIGVSGFINVII